MSAKLGLAMLGFAAAATPQPLPWAAMNLSSVDAPR